MFIRIGNADQLLSIIGMTSSGLDFGSFSIKRAIECGIEIDECGVLTPNSDLQQAGLLRHHMEALIMAQPSDTGMSGGAQFIAFRLRA